MPPPRTTVTRAEFEVLLGMCDHLSADQLADRTYRATSTVKTHMHRLYKKLGVHSAPEAVIKAWRVGLLRSCPVCRQPRMPAPSEGYALMFDQGGLSPRLVDHLRLIAIGYTNEEIARELSLSVSTVRMHVNRLLVALHVNDRAHAVAIGFAEGYLIPEDVRGSNKRKG